MAISPPTLPAVQLPATLPRPLSQPQSPAAPSATPPVSQSLSDPAAAPIVEPGAASPAPRPTGTPQAGLTSRVDGGTVAFTTIVIFLLTGVWYFGHRLALQVPEFFRG